ncbi:hypothetical protein RJ035_005773 [Blastomyces gilchristii]
MMPNQQSSAETTFMDDRTLLSLPRVNRSFKAACGQGRLLRRLNAHRRILRGDIGTPSRFNPLDNCTFCEGPYGKHVVFQYDENFMSVCGPVTGHDRVPRLMYPVLFGGGELCFGYELTGVSGPKLVVRCVSDWRLVAERSFNGEVFAMNSAEEWCIFHRDSDLLIQFTRQHGEISIWNSSLRRPLHKLLHPTATQISALPKRGGVAALSATDGAVRVWKDINKPGCLFEFIVPNARRFCPLGLCVLRFDIVSDCSLDDVYLLDTGEPLSCRQECLIKGELCADFLDGAYVVRYPGQYPHSRKEVTFKVFDCTGIQTASFDHLSARACVNLMGTYLATTGDDGCLKIWAKDGKLLGQAWLGYSCVALFAHDCGLIATSFYESSFLFDEIAEWDFSTV